MTAAKAKKEEKKQDDLTAEEEKKAKRKATVVKPPDKKEVKQNHTFAKRHLVLKWWKGGEQFVANVNPGQPFPGDVPDEIAAEQRAKGLAQYGQLEEGYYPGIKRKDE